MLFAIERHEPDRIAVIDDKGRHSYGELCRDALGMGRAAGNRALGFALCSNVYASLCGYVGALSCKNVPLLLPSDIDSGYLSFLLANYRPSWIWLPEERAGEHTGESAEELSGFSRSLTLEGYVLLVRSAVDSASGEEKAGPPLAGDLALLLTTSGSTGSPKLVRQTLRNIEANAASIVSYLELDSTERPITTLPMHYTYGLSILNSHLLVGGTVLMTEQSLIQNPFWDFFHAQGATSFGGVPYTYAMLKRIGFFEKDLPGLRSFTQAGGKLDSGLHALCAAYAARYKKRFYVMYGQTEATARMGYLPWRMAADKCGCVGFAIPGGRFSLVDAQGQEITTPDTVGELIYEGENVTPGYAQCGADLLKGDERRGVLRTGDMALCDADGCYRIVGRKKRFLKMYGKRISLDECEQLIRTRFAGLDCACYGQDDLMCIAVTDAALCAEVRDYCAAALRLLRSSFAVRALPEIPRNSAGKTLYIQLEDKA